VYKTENLLFVSQGVDGLLASSFDSRSRAKNNTDGYRYKEGQDYDLPGYRRLQVAENPKQQVNQDGHDDANEPTGYGQHGGFYNELVQYLAISSADRLAYADLVHPLGHAYQHNVHYAYPAHQQAYGRDAGDKACE
jgi:hypothetical protein